MNRDQVTGLVIPDCWGLAGTGKEAGRGGEIPAAGLGVGLDIYFFRFIYSIVYIYYKLQISRLQGESVPA